MSENEKPLTMSHEHRNIIISYIFCVVGLFMGYHAGFVFTQLYIVPTISTIELWVFIESWCFAGVFSGWYTSKMFWCTCGI
jgi:hypothetical protein